MEERSIVGVALLRDEDRVVAWSLGNVTAFCDRLIVLDNGSTDRTREIVEALARTHAHVEVHDVPDAYDTHRFVEPLAGLPIWVLGVDGDEIFDRAGLARLRPQLLAGAYDDAFSLVGHTLHPVRGDLGAVEGFASPEARSIVKLYNFAAIDSWRQGRHERLHGKNKRFRPGWSAESIRRLDVETGWDEADLRCLHLCFLPRSSRMADADAARANPVEARSRAKPLKGVERFARRLLGLPERRPNYKRAHYAQGPLVARSLDGFGRPTDHLAVDPEAAAAEASLAAALRGPAEAAAGLPASSGVPLRLEPAR